MKLFGVEIIPLKFNYNCLNNYTKRYTERYIEIPIALAFIQNIIKDDKFLEFGCTCPYYFKTLSNHIVYDLTDTHPDNIKKDLRNLTNADYSSNIISISTIEHINCPQYGIDIKEDTFSSVSILKKIIELSHKFLITVPIGQNKLLDEFILSIDNNKVIKYVGRCPLNSDNWDIIDREKVTGEYLIDGTYQNANCICVISNCF